MTIPTFSCRSSLSYAVLIILLFFLLLAYNNTFIVNGRLSLSEYGPNNKPSPEIIVHPPDGYTRQQSQMDKVEASIGTSILHRKSHSQLPNHLDNITSGNNIPEHGLETVDTTTAFSGRCSNSSSECKDGKSKHLSKALIIGVTKCGTTALEWFLLLHDQIQSGVGEPHFFDWYYDRGVDWYCTQMPCTYDNVVVLERTPRYYVHLSQHNVYDFDPNMKLLLIVREPVDRMVSHLVHNYGYHKWEFYKNIVISSRNGTINEYARQIYQSQYVKYLDSWTKLFNFEEQMLIIDYRDLIENPYDVVYRVETFLNLEHKVQPDMMYFDNDKGFYCKYTDKELNATTCMGSAKGRKHPTVPSDDVKKFKQFFKPWNTKFFEAIGQDFGWNDDIH